METIEILTLLAIIAAVLVPIRAKYQVVPKCLVFLVFFGLLGIPDALMTSKFAYLHPEMERNVLAAAFLGVPYLFPVGVFIWVFGWIALAELFERKKISFVPPIIFTLLFLGHWSGFSSWLKYMTPDLWLEMGALTVGTLVLLYLNYVTSYGATATLFNRK
jgi:hypothetical protein